MIGKNNFEIAVRVFVIAGVVAAAVGCKPHFPESPTPTPTLVALQVHYLSPHTNLNPGNTMTLAAYAINSEGIYERVSPQWLSLDSAVATVTTGTVRAVANGSTDVVAAYMGMTAAARIVVGSNPPFRIELRGFTRQVGEFEAIVRSGSGTNTSDLTTQARWTSSNPEILSVDSGRGTARLPGTAAISASVGNSTTTMYLSIEPIRTLP